MIPYIKGISETLARMYKRYDISTAMKPYTTIRRLLVHPKDKRTLEETAGLVYKIPCADCDMVYIGETGRQFSVRKKEHQDEAEEASKQHFTRANRKNSETVWNKSAITDHVAQTNHTINWQEASSVDRETIRPVRWIRESIQIRKLGKSTFNRDGGQHTLARTYDPLLLITTPSGGKQ